MQEPQLASLRHERAHFLLGIALHGHRQWSGHAPRSPVLCRFTTSHQEEIECKRRRPTLDRLKASTQLPYHTLECDDCAPDT